MSNQMDVVGKPFQILGFDLLIDNKLKAWILEINDHPSLNIYFDTSAGMDHAVMTDADICQVDFHVKSRLVRDTILLTKKKRVTVEQTREFGTLTKIHPSEESGESAIDMYSLVRQLRTVFYSLTPIKTKAQITSQNFEKLFNKPVVKGTGMQKIEMALAF